MLGEMSSMDELAEGRREGKQKKAKDGGGGESTLVNKEHHEDIFGCVGEARLKEDKGTKRGRGRKEVWSSQVGEHNRGIWGVGTDLIVANKRGEFKEN